MCLLSTADFFFSNLTFFKIFRSSIRVVNGLGPEGRSCSEFKLFGKVIVSIDKQNAFGRD